MLSVPPTMRVFVATGAADMRKSFRGLVALTVGVVRQDPMSGHLYVFFNARKNMMKAIYWDRNGYCLVAKRLERGSFVLPHAKDGVVELEAIELALLLEGIDLSAARRRPRWTPSATWAP